MGWISVVFAVLIAATLVMMIMRNRNVGFGGGSSSASGYEQGIMTITGSSERKPGDKNGQWSCTISGTITGPQTAPTEVYGQFVFGDADSQPRIGEDRPVVYKPGKAATSWRLIKADS